MSSTGPAGARGTPFARRSSPVTSDPCWTNSRCPRGELFERLGDAGESVFAFLVEDFLAGRFGDSLERNVVDEYLERRGWLERAPARGCLLALRDSSPSLFEVVGVRRGRDLTVRDLIVDEESVTVQDKLASATGLPRRAPRAAARLAADLPSGMRRASWPNGRTGPGPGEKRFRLRRTKPRSARSWRTATEPSSIRRSRCSAAALPGRRRRSRRVAPVWRSGSRGSRTPNPGTRSGMGADRSTPAGSGRS